MEPVYVVRFAGCYRFGDLEAKRDGFMRMNGDALGDRVVFIDGSVEDVYQISERELRDLVELVGFGDDGR